MTKLGTVKTIKRIENGVPKYIKHYGLQENNFLIDGLTIISRFAGSKKAHFSDGKYHTRDNHYKVFLTFKNKTESFDFWTSYAKSNITTIEDLEGFMECITSDAKIGSNYGFMTDKEGAEEFIREFGYKDFREALVVFKGLRETYKKMMKLFGNQTDETINKIWSILTD